MASKVYGVLCLCSVLPSVGGACVVSAMYSALATLRGAARISCLSATDAMLRHGRPSRHGEPRPLRHRRRGRRPIRRLVQKTCGRIPVHLARVRMYTCVQNIMCKKPPFYTQSRERATHRHTYVHIHICICITRTYTDRDRDTDTDTDTYTCACTCTYTHQGELFIICDDVCRCLICIPC